MHFDEIHTQFERSLNIVPHSTSRMSIFKKLGGVLSHLAIEKMVKEIDNDPSDCDHILSTTFGLMCACQLHVKLRNRRTVDPVHDVNVFWRTLHMGEPPETRQQSIRDQFLHWAADRSETATEDEMRSYFDNSNASQLFVDEPFVAQRRGRKPKAIGKRLPSGWETPNQSQKNSAASNDDSGSLASNGRTLKYQSQMPPQTQFWIRGHNDVIDEGNCGFRVIAQYNTVNKSVGQTSGKNSLMSCTQQADVYRRNDRSTGR